MKFPAFLPIALGSVAILCAQEVVAPIYRVEVISRTTKAINYGHRSEPTKIDLKGTILMPEARGEAKIESARGAMQVEAKFEKLDAPSRFGAEYLTYVLWAITPEGRSMNLGEVVPGWSNKAKLKTAVDMQSFALIVTAEPYFSVTQPSDAVVMENFVRPDTIGRVEEVAAKYELLPRKRFYYTVNRPVPSGPMVSMDQYEALSALYQAQNSIQIARSQRADLFAADTLAKAEQLYDQAQRYHATKGSSKSVVMTARQAAQTAEDARVIAIKRQAPSDEARARE